MEYKQAKDKSYYNHHANGDATWIFSEIVENMPEYFVEVKEDWIDELIDRILPHIENSLETAEDYQWIREAIEKYMPNGKNTVTVPKPNKDETSLYKIKWTIQIKHCDCWCDNIGKL